MELNYYIQKFYLGNQSDSYHVSSITVIKVYNNCFLKETLLQLWNQLELEMIPDNWTQHFNEQTSQLLLSDEALQFHSTTLNRTEFLQTSAEFHQTDCVTPVYALHLDTEEERKIQE